MIYGYIRVSTDRQDCENQKVGIEAKARKMGVRIDKYIQDAGISGTTEPDSRALGGCLRHLRAGDVIICSELSRLGRKLFMIMRILEYCMDIGARLYTVKDGYELGDNIQSKVLAFAFGLSAEIERELISKRTKEGLRKRKQDGVHLGRPIGRTNQRCKLDTQKRFIKRQMLYGCPQYKLAQKLGVSPKTLRKFIGSVRVAA